jgi:hypothetical protein
MKVSLMARREDFVTVFLKSFERFCGSYFGRSVSIASNGHGLVRFRMNAKLNIIYPEKISASILEQLTAEFQHHDRFSRRVLQKLYCRLSSAKSTRCLLSKPLFSVDTETEFLQDWVFLPGNHSVRIVDTQKEHCYVFPKVGFDPHYFLNDAVARQRYSYLHAPAVHEISTDGAWYSEERISALPVTRFGDPELETRILDAAVRDLVRLRENTVETTSLGDVFDSTNELVRGMLQSSDSLPDAVRHQLDEVLGRCTRLVADNRAVPLPSCVTHGDFQPGNLLTDGDRFWLIDWEYFGRRSLTYDYFTWTLQARHARDLGRRLDAAVLAHGSAESIDVWGHAQTGHIGALIAVFLVEDFLLKLQETSSAAITDKTYSLAPWLGEVLPFLVRLEESSLRHD